MVEKKTLNSTFSLYSVYATGANGEICHFALYVE